MTTRIENDTLTIALEGRIDTTNAPEVEKELMDAVADAAGMNIEIDAGNLEYISSAGLRVLLRLSKQTDRKLPVLEVSNEVYEIFDTTGFTELLDVQKRLRSMDVEGLPVIGRGATATVYRIDRETVVKVFNPEVSAGMIQHEKDSAKNAFVIGIPTAISYDLVKVGNSYGAVYELLDAEDFSKVLRADKGKIDANMEKLAATMRSMHEIETDTAKFQSAKLASIQRLPLMSSICSQDEIDRLRSIYEAVPDRKTFVHGDCHPGNVMVQNGEFVFIDMTNCGYGHPILDMGSMCMTYHLAEVPGGFEYNPQLAGLTAEDRSHIWEVFLRSYFEGRDEAFIRKAERQITAVTSVGALFVAAYMPGIYSPEFVEALKRETLIYADNDLEALCF